MKEAETGVIDTLWKWRKGRPEPKTVGDRQKLEEVKKWTLPSEPAVGALPAHMLV